jgi:hypothetical protein
LKRKSNGLIKRPEGLYQLSVVVAVRAEAEHPVPLGQLVPKVKLVLLDPEVFRVSQD